MGLIAFSFAANDVYAADDDGDDEAAEEAPKKAKKKGKKKRPTPSKAYVSIHKFENKSSASAAAVATVQSRIQQFIVGTRKFEVIEREQLSTVMKEAGLAAGGVTDAEDGHAPELSEEELAPWCSAQVAFRNPQGTFEKHQNSDRLVLGLQ